MIGEGSVKMTPEHELESEDDEAPEEVTFQTAKVSAEESARLKREVARRDKVLLKEKRKRKIELFKDQKKKKLLSEDILHTISSLPDDQKQPSERCNEENTDDGGEPEHQVKTKRAKKLVPQKRLAKKYNILRLKDCGTIDLQQKKAENFIKKKLYGASQNRTTANALLSVSSKKGSVKKAAAQFTDNAWGVKEKQNATHFKFAWTKRHKL